MTNLSDDAHAPMALSYRTMEERTIVPGAIAPDLTIKLRAISDGVAKLWVERDNTLVSCDELPELCVICAGASDTDPALQYHAVLGVFAVHAPAVGGCYIIEWVKSYEVFVCGQRVATIACQRQQSMLACSGASIM